MGRKRTLPATPAGEPAKYSLLIPAELDAKILEICRLRGRRVTQSDVVREVLRDNLDRYLDEARRPGPPAGAGRRVAVDLNEQVRQALELAARDYNLDLQGVIRLVLAEHLPEIMRRARERREALNQAIESELARDDARRMTEG